MQWEIWWFAAKIALVLIRALVVKQLIENLVAYVMFRTCSRLGIGIDVKMEAAGMGGKGFLRRLVPSLILSGWSCPFE